MMCLHSLLSDRFKNAATSVGHSVRGIWLTVCLLSLTGATSDADVQAELQLSDRNTEAPFCYLVNGHRRWPIATGRRTDEQQVRLSISASGENSTSSSNAAKIRSGALKIAVSPDGFLDVWSENAADTPTLELNITVQSPGTAEENAASVTQRLQLRPAPPNRPLTYLADFGDDIIRMFLRSANDYRPVTKDAFDQYFRRLQTQGISRLIVWQSPFPYIVDPTNYDPEDWQRYVGQATAILQHEALAQGIRDRGAYASWAWLQQLMALRLMPELGEMLSTSAQQHGIRLTASYRPFEAALTKYYVVPTFDHEGRYLWGFQPLCSPTVNYHADELGFVHYRKVLEQMGHVDQARLTRLTLPGDAAVSVSNQDLRLIAAPFPPLASESYVLVRQADGTFDLQSWATVRPAALKHVVSLDNITVTSDERGIQLDGIELPDHCRYLWLSQSDDSAAEWTVHADNPVQLFAEAGNRLGGENVWFAWDEQDGQPEPTRVSGIPPNGHYHAEFQATEASIGRCLSGPGRINLRDKQLVISLGADSAIEMMDFQQKATRATAVRQLRTVLSLPAFDCILINTRSHTQMAGYLGDDGNTVESIAAHRRRGTRSIWQTGLDKVYAPRSVASLPSLQELARTSTSVEHITTLQPGEWRAVTCQTPGTWPWRYARNQQVAAGARQLILDLQHEFPETPMQAVIPPSAAAVDRILHRLESQKDSNGNPLGRDYYRRLWSSNNHMPNFGEGMAMVDLSGTHVAPVLLGTGGYSQDSVALDIYVQECLKDLSDNRGSGFRGSRSYFFEAQGSLRAKDRPAARRNREAVICYLLEQTGELDEVILYEAADWTYFLPLSNPDLTSHGFLDRRERSSFPPLDSGR